MTTPTRRVLLADDDEDQRHLVGEGIRRLGYELTEVGDGKSALEALQLSHPPRIAVVDWNMPGMSGPELCERIRATTSQHYIYIILLTIRDDIDDVRSGLAAGADDYLIKPSHPVELQARMDVGWRVIDANDRLLSAIFELTTANDMLAAFSRTLAHDLRGILTTIGGYSYLLERDHSLTADAHELAESISAAGNRMRAIVDDVLVLETATRGPERSTFDLRDVIAEASADAPGVKVVVERLPSHFVAHRSSVARSFKNLFENASRYARRPDREFVSISVDTHEDDHSWTFIVEDDGPGIPEIDRKRVFETFERGTNAVDQHGTGLGLSIVAACARAHDGSIELSEGSYGGARFVLTLSKPTATPAGV